jgi:hypothetical protein
MSGKTTWRATFSVILSAAKDLRGAIQCLMRAFAMTRLNQHTAGSNWPMPHPTLVPALRVDSSASLGMTERGRMHGHIPRE